jgi:hypothetical protein
MEQKVINNYHRIWVNAEDFIDIPWENKIFVLLKQPLSPDEANDLIRIIMKKLKPTQPETYNFCKFKKTYHKS